MIKLTHYLLTKTNYKNHFRLQNNTKTHNTKDNKYSKRIKKTLALDVERWIADSYNAKTPFEAILSQRNKTEEIKGIASSKHVSWGNEKEFRAFYEGEDNGSGEAVFCSVLNLKIKAIYAGIKCKEKYKRKLQRIAKSLKVDYYEMHVSADRYSLYKELKK